MTLFDVPRVSQSLPDGYTAVPVLGEPAGAALRVCVLVKRAAEPAGGALVVLRENLDSRVFLGCVLDAGARVHAYVEVWVQTAGGLNGTTAMYRRAVTNATLDERWRRFAEALNDLDSDGLLVTGWEGRHPLPAFIDWRKGALVHPVQAETGAAWSLCEDDALLRKHDLPPYGQSLHRYLYVAGSGSGAARFVPVTPEAPTNAHTVSLPEVWAGSEQAVALNPEGGLLLVRAHDHLGFEEYAGVLAGGAWQGVPHGRSVLDPGGVGKTLGAVHHPARLFLGARGREGRLLETLHLKVRAVGEMIRAVSALVDRQQRPLLNVSQESFRVRFPDAGTGLPLLWTAQAVLVAPGEAATGTIESSDIRYHLRASESSVSIYRPLSDKGLGGGRGEARIRQVTDTGRGLLVEGTFRARDEVPVSADDLVWLRLSLGAQPVDLYAHFENDAALARGECRFRTIEQRLPAPVAERIRGAEGVPLANTPFEVIPQLGAACDLYALAVLGVRLLLVNKETKLAIALDEMLSLARECGAVAAENPDLPAVIAGLFGRDARWANALGPNRLTDDELSAEAAFRCVPPSLWWRVLAMLVRMFPGVSAYSSSSSPGDGAQGALPAVFAVALGEADELLRTTGALIVTDWDRNREVRDVIEALRARHEGAQA
jgi:hypothetical protein